MTTTMKTGRTAWERLTGTNKPVAAEKRYPNPLDLRTGAAVRIDEADLDRNLYTVTTIRAWDRTAAGRKVAPLTDYVLRAGEDSVLLRVVPDQSEPTNPKKHRILVLTEFHREGWSDDCLATLDAVCDKSGELYKDRGTENEVCYWRLHDLRIPYHAVVTEMTDSDGSGAVDDHEISVMPYTLWDFSRATASAGGQPLTEYLYVEFSGDYNPDTRKAVGGDKTLVMYRGVELTPARVHAYDRS